jgi:hypothetical protein
LDSGHGSWVLSYHPLDICPPKHRM